MRGMMAQGAGHGDAVSLGELPVERLVEKSVPKHLDAAWHWTPLQALVQSQHCQDLALHCMSMLRTNYTLLCCDHLIGSLEPEAGGFG